MRRFRCVVVDHHAGPLLSEVLALLRARADVDCEVETAQAARRARADLLLVCSGAGGRDTLLPLVAGYRGFDMPRALLVVGELDSAQDLRALIAFGVSDFLRLPLSAAEFIARIERVLGPCNRLDADPVVDWLGADEPALVSANARFNAQLARLPRLASAGADVLVCGARGSGRRAIARTLARLAGDAAPVVVHADELETWLARHDADRAAGTDARCVLVYDLDTVPPDTQRRLADMLLAQRAAGSQQRLVATTTADAPVLLARGALIEPLAQLLQVHRVRVLALRERPDDIVSLARTMIGALCARDRRPLPALTPAAAAQLISHPWPDNLFGLHATLEHALRSAGPMVTAQDLLLEGVEDREAREQSLQEVKARLVVSFERSFLEQLLEVCRGNINMAARLSKKNRRSLFELIRKHDIDVDRYRRIDDAPAAPPAERLPPYQPGIA